MHVHSTALSIFKKPPSLPDYIITTHPWIHGCELSSQNLVDIDRLAINYLNLHVLLLFPPSTFEQSSVSHITSRPNYSKEYHRSAIAQFPDSFSIRRLRTVEWKDPVAELPEMILMGTIRRS
jgi:hypothetical protein